MSVFAVLLVSIAGTAADTQAKDLRFSRDVLPILAENCFACHGFDEAAREADLRLDTKQGALGSGIVVAGNPTASPLIERINSKDPSDQMPPPDSGKQLTDAQREILRQWVAQGAAYEKHWAFQSPQRSEPPSVPNSRHPVDRFVLSRLSDSGLTPSPSADPGTLIRRVCLDLIGLPPTPAEIDQFTVAFERNPEIAWQTLVDRLLGSPHYGERWGRWWLDQARYADSNGYSVDSPRSIWRYREWVVDALNQGMPFDQFTIEQLAGDLLPDASVGQQVATGFHRNTQINQEGGIDREQFRIDSVFDRVATTGTVWMGLTIGCAQCHDHKFDPIKQEEFYRLFAFFNDQDEPSIKVYDPDLDISAITAQKKQAERDLGAYFVSHSAEQLDWEHRLDDEAKKKLPSKVTKALAVESQKRNLGQKFEIASVWQGTDHQAFLLLKKRYDELSKILNNAPTTLVLRERGTPRKTAILIKGDFTRPAEEVTPGTPAILHPFKSDHERPNRLDLARWLVSPENPLTARVIVNRVWQQYFGRGLVDTENDFGLLGARPTHRGLLDWLAIHFVERGWDLKSIHRLIVTSHTYRQSSAFRGDLAEVDADNRLLGRQQRLRLDAEIVRDVALVACGQFSSRLGGPPVYPPIPNAVMSQGQVRRSWKASTGADRYRRGLYTFVYRATPPPSLNVFDAPDGYSSCTRRNRSNTPLQSLALMNDAAFFEFAQSLQRTIDKDGLEDAFRSCTGRQPDESELELLRRLDSLTAARVLLNLDETITRE
ncbi:MAG: PSD1 and planctomycete cytochrome C domain-containing protein [Rubripirellula sp.]|nr:PSD1 and planctomycete cytochrome C domain-containing protein [Rubripirellula sp.]